MNYLCNILDFAGIFAGIGAIAVFISLKANHDWNRRKAALELVSSWSSTTLEHRKAIEKALPGIFDSDNRSQEVVEISMKRATEIYLCTHEAVEDWELRFHIVELLNYFERLSLAYLHKVGDNKILDIAFKSPLIRWHKILNPYINIVLERRGYDAWSPFTDLVNHWTKVKVKFRIPTA